jgi:hypothetical protein
VNGSSDDPRVEECNKPALALAMFVTTKNQGSDFPRPDLIWRAVYIRPGPTAIPQVEISVAGA